MPERRQALLFATLNLMVVNGVMLVMHYPLVVEKERKNLQESPLIVKLNPKAGINRIVRQDAF